jgi:mono/diheme cytochrome c family protein
MFWWRSKESTTSKFLVFVIAAALLASCSIPSQLSGEGFVPGYTGMPIPAQYLGLRDPFTLQDQAALNAGISLYHRGYPSCAYCHGEDGRGNGIGASYIGLRPADYSAPPMLTAFRQHPDYVFWWVSEGVAQSSMPSFKDLMSDTQRWQVITYAWSLGEKGTKATPSPEVPVATPVVTGNIANGGALFESQGCANCHVNGQAPPASALAGLSQFQIQIIVRTGVDGMPQFNKTVLDDQQLNDIIAYLKASQT